MELGATICIPASPRCDQCPLTSLCVARQKGLQSQIPSPKARPTRTPVTHSSILVRDSAGRLLMDAAPRRACGPACGRPRPLKPTALQPQRGWQPGSVSPPFVAWVASFTTRPTAPLSLSSGMAALSSTCPKTEQIVHGWSQPKASRWAMRSAASSRWPSQSAPPSPRVYLDLMLIAVVIPVYNEARWVKDAVQRVLSTPPPQGCTRRIILVDDGSTDGTRPIIEDLAKADGIVAVFHQINQGKGAASAAVSPPRTRLEPTSCSSTTPTWSTTLPTTPRSSPPSSTGVPTRSSAPASSARLTACSITGTLLPTDSSRPAATWSRT